MCKIMYFLNCCVRLSDKHYWYFIDNLKCFYYKTTNQSRSGCRTM